MIKQYEKKDGKKYWMFKAYLGIDPVTGKKRYTTKRGFATKKEAKIAMARLQTSVQDKGLKTSITNKNILFEDVYNEWIEGYKNTVKESTFAMQKRVCKNHILPTFGKLQIKNVTTQFCQKQANEWFQNFKQYSNFIGITSAIFEYARKANYIDINPVKNVVRPKRKYSIDEETKLDNYYSKEKLKYFLTYVKENFNTETYTMFLLLSFTGMRKGELQALRWKDIDLIDGVVSVKQTLTTGLDNKLIFQTPKTRKSLRDISIDENTKQQLSAWKKEQSKITPSISDDKKLVFGDENNSPKYLDYLNHNLKLVLKDTDLPKITIHGFRHTHCSLLFEAGASIKDVQERLGHTDIKTTMEIYTHINKESKEKTANTFADFINI